MKPGLNLPKFDNATPAAMSKNLLLSAQWWPNGSPSDWGGPYDAAHPTTTFNAPSYGADGWPTSLGSGQTLTIHLMNADDYGSTSAAWLPTGTYTIKTTGSGTFRWYTENFTATGGTGTFSHTVNSGDARQNPTVVINTTTTGDPLKITGIYRPGYNPATDPNPTQVLTNEFVNDIAGFKPLRTVDWQVVNGPGGGVANGIVNFADLTPSVRPYTWELSAPGSLGVPPAVWCELANLTGADLWLHVPDGASDSFVTDMADYLAAHITSSTSLVYLELSNEVWNSGFPQQALAISRGRAASFYTTTQKNAMSDGEIRGRYHAWRSWQVHGLFTGTGHFPAARTVKILATQNDNTGIAPILLDEYVTVRGGAGVTLAMAPYPGYDVDDSSTAAASPTTADVTAVFTQLATSLNTIATNMAANKATTTHNSVYGTDYTGVGACCYEGGPSLQYAGGTPGSTAYINTNTLYGLVNRDPRMRDHVNAIAAQADAKLGPTAAFCFYNHISTYNAGNGYWGAKEYLSQPESSAPKWAALRAMVAPPSPNFIGYSAPASPTGPRTTVVLKRVT